MHIKSLHTAWHSFYISTYAYIGGKNMYLQDTYGANGFTARTYVAFVAIGNFLLCQMNGQTHVRLGIIININVQTYSARDLKEIYQTNTFFI